MDISSFLKNGETEPLLDESCLLEIDGENLSSEVDKGSRLQKKASCWIAPASILGFEGLVSIAFFGISTNLVVYLRTVLHQSNASSASNANVWFGTCFFTPILGAVIVDTFWGNYLTLFVSSLIYLLGVGFITFSALFSSPRPFSFVGPSCQQVQNFAFSSGLYLVAFGCGGFKAALLPLGADQFDDRNTEERKKKESFFNWFYVCANFGSIIAGTLVVWIQENVDWALGFSISTVCIALALGTLIMVKPYYRMRNPSGSPLKRILQVLVASFSKMSMEVPKDSSLLYEVEDRSKNFQQLRLGLTNEFRFLDKAAIISESDVRAGEGRNCWKLCTVTEVEELKILLRLLPIWMSSIIFSAAYAQTSTTFIQQGSVMDNHIGSFSIPPASLSSFHVISVMAWILFYDKIIHPTAKSLFGNSAVITQLQRMGIGRFLMIVSMASAALVETKRLESIKNGACISMGWQIPQYFFSAVAGCFANVSELEFFYDQAPEMMKSICVSLTMVAVALGRYLSSFIVVFVQLLTMNGSSQGWIDDDLNNGHLDYYFWALAGMSAVNFVVYIARARNYKHKRILSED